MSLDRMTIAELEKYLGEKEELSSEDEDLLRQDGRRGAVKILDRHLRRKKSRTDETERLEKMLFEEKILWSRGYRYIAGLDEAGRGPLAGPVMAAAVVFKPGITIDGLNDSKKLAAAKREALFEKIITQAEAYGIGSATRAEIDRYNIHRASMMAMKRALEKLAVKPDYLLVDGFSITNYPLEQKALTGGDSLSLSIAAASVLAKVTRDKIMLNLHDLYPQYNFMQNKGYGTLEHRQAIYSHGPCPEHRTSFTLKQLPCE